MRRAEATGIAPRRVQATRADRLRATLLVTVPHTDAGAQLIRGRSSICGSRLCSRVPLAATAGAATAEAVAGTARRRVARRAMVEVAILPEEAAEVTLAVAEAVIPAVEVGVAIRAVAEADTPEAITNKLM